ncbi:NR LBD domain-containing protein [Caenorhabditis elegans]|uniref:NR LBD domain-containing protein n=1 Tax=Caenorhabditis elegans TaxID=6239 RepID=Q9GYF7_CAEEL|nr:NR LBD domain-containing protein [Caenorhabditis elegans]CCD62009.1 NR LBD domain-containing protein [Caenorhabditis elegans]|eukprot:NP_501076.2 Nuclear Hormone Receptor family [Caenorhabditis elegans]
MGILLQYVEFSNLWVDGLWAEIQLEQWNKISNTSESISFGADNIHFSTFISNFRSSVGEPMAHLKLDMVEYAALKALCFWKLGYVDFGVTLKIVAQEHYLLVSTALTDYHLAEKG